MWNNTYVKMTLIILNKKAIEIITEWRAMIIADPLMWQTGRLSYLLQYIKD